MSAQRRFVFLIALTLILTVISVPIENVAAAGVLDQQQTVINYSFGLFTPPLAASTNFWGQTFTAGLTGSLTEVDLAIACNSDNQGPCTAFGPVTVEIHSGSPTGTLLGSSSLPSSTFPIILPEPTAFFAFTFSSPSVVAGSVYAIVITTTTAFDAGPEYIVGASITNPYSAGNAWVYNGIIWTDGGFSTTDLAFKTFVTPAAIPEYPLGLPLLAIFMVIAYGLIKRRTRHPENI